MYEDWQIVQTAFPVQSRIDSEPVLGWNRWPQILILALLPFVVVSFLAHVAVYARSHNFRESVVDGPIAWHAILILIAWICCWFFVCQKNRIRMRANSILHERFVFWAAVVVACNSCAFWTLILLAEWYFPGAAHSVLLCGCILAALGLGVLSIANFACAFFAKSVFTRAVLVYLAVVSGPQICCLFGFVGVMPA